MIARLYRQYIPADAPIWIKVGVTALGAPSISFEMRVRAIVH